MLMPRLHAFKENISTKNGAAGRGRTCDLLVTNELLYQLSYSGTLTIILP